jgi:beta-glucosidase-like glycosyl hydrolase
MGAIAKHTEIEDASVRAFLAGEDMLLICATPSTIRRGYRALLEAARKGSVSEKRIHSSLKRIAATKALVKPPPPLDMDKYNRLADEIRRLNETLEYRYPGESNVQ